MIARCFTPPNFRVVAVDESGRKEEWITKAESEVALIERLEEDGWTIETISPYNFSTWEKRAAELNAQIEAEWNKGDKLKFSSKQWRQLKRHLFEMFGDKCAYCEALSTHVTPGDVEHYRPKARVDDDESHPGYYWLAYDTENLLPACEECNRARGKMNRFPVEEGTRAFDPNDLEEERPLLLNPYLDDAPLIHIRFVKSGHVEPLTEKGAKSVDIYHLKRAKLRRDREAGINNMLRDLEVAVHQRGPKAAVDDMLEELREGKREYLAALLSCLLIWVEEKKREYAEAGEIIAAES